MGMSKVQIANLALGRLGNIGTIENLDPPHTTVEKVVDLWWDITRQAALKALKPNFAFYRDVLPLSTETPAFGYSYCYVYPADCLHVLGIGDIDKWENNLSIEGNYIITDEGGENGLEVRYVRDILDATRYSPEFVMLLSWMLADNICIGITQDTVKQQVVHQLAQSKLAEATSLNTQENRPIRKNFSKFKNARIIDDPMGYNKK